MDFHAPLTSHLSSYNIVDKSSIFCSSFSHIPNDVCSHSIVKGRKGGGENFFLSKFRTDKGFDLFLRSTISEDRGGRKEEKVKEKGEKNRQ